jgi:DNA-directed RNA polymerase specialized sigma24 family protein
MYNHLFTDRVANIIPAVARKYSGGNDSVYDELVSYMGLRVASYLPRYDPNRGTQFKTWVYKLAVFSAKNYFWLIKRKGKSKRDIPTVSLNVKTGTSDSEFVNLVADRKATDPGDGVASRQMVRKLFNRLKPLDQRIVSMMLDGYGAYHVGRIVGLSHQGVLNRYRRALKRLKNSYHLLVSGKAGTKVIRQWRAVDQDRANKQMSEALAKAHDSYMRSVQTERTLTGWPELPEVQGRILNYLKTVPQAKDSEICLGVSISLQWCRDSMSILKRKGYVLKVGSQRSGTYRINPSISGEGSI